MQPQISPEKFFARVNHDVLMAGVGRKVKDPGVLKLIRGYLEAGLMEGGWRVHGVKGGRRAVLFPRCYGTSCWTNWIANWNDGVMVSADTLRMATSTSKAIGQDRGSGSPSRRFWSKD